MSIICNIYLVANLNNGYCRKFLIKFQLTTLYWYIKHVIHAMEARTLVMELRRRAIKRWVPCGDMDCRLKIPHSAKAECGFRTTPEECLYDSGPIGPSVYGLIIQYNTIQ